MASRAVWLASDRTAPTPSARRGKAKQRKPVPQRRLPPENIVEAGIAETGLDPSADLDRWRLAWRELWEVERDAARDTLVARLAEAEGAVRELRATLASERQLHARAVAERQSWADEAVEATRAVAERESAARNALQECRAELEHTKLRAARAELAAAQAVEEAAAADGARVLAERVSSTQLAASHDEISMLRQQLHARAAGMGAIEDACDRNATRAEAAASEARQIRFQLATSAEAMRVSELEASRSEAHASSLAGDLAAREAEFARVAGILSTLRAAPTMLQPSSSSATPLSADVEAATDDAHAIHSKVLQEAVGAAALAEELRQLDGLDGSVLELRSALARSMATCEEQRAHAASTEVALTQCRCDVDALRRGRADLEHTIASAHDATRAAEGRFAEAVGAIRSSVDAQLAVQSERLRVWEELVGLHGKPDAWSLNATAGMALIRGRRHLGDLSELLNEERRLIAEQGRLIAGARSQK